eukprot:CAMPEP_0181170890 /NCGR_PEP_ID=MMETSP1096-20121128/1609_1 /TAXON_ID=156174 ORGANISM="Chrysochromulina ericina, Strain CCMP281" /NCGR_SAMPLE_ID=MMETSP1096 /ASSEMBLY_ACC=CAM_ASM_000453 /LENGTH=34 /DNA_ID= /DNA_START= /DNA_END= /DNA_ORIENTATION=
MKPHHHPAWPMSPEGDHMICFQPSSVCHHISHLV